MKTKIYHQKDVEEAANVIKEGGLVSFPTETVYGLGADATNIDAVKKVYLAKGRPSDNPLIVHVASKEMISKYVSMIPEKANHLMDSFWPGPLTVILPLSKEANLSISMTHPLDNAAFRMPNNPVTLELIKTSNLPLVGPSANTSGKPSPTTAMHVFNDLNGKIEAILDDGECEVGIESTVIDMTQPDKPTILRPGAITKEDIEQIIGETFVDNHLVDDHQAPKSPGMKYKHYSPETDVVIVKDKISDWQNAISYYQKEGKKIAILSSHQIYDDLSDYSVFTYYPLSEKKDVISAMRHLFSGLRQLDAELTGFDGIILAEGYEETSKNMGYMNRLKKAANQTFFRN
ncbi:L-threonylcarbamoyladenylate synthase [Vagococcus sp. JNUCC 83]